MVNVLVTNDDGINARGIRALIEALSEYANVYVAAPAEQQSGKSQSITYLTPVHVEEREVKGAVAAYAVEGTPADCVKWGICILGKRGIDFDYVFSGINLGANTGLAAYYSGTIAAAREGALYGVSSFALSVKHHYASEFEYICSLIPMLMDIASRVSKDTIISVNAPNLPPEEVKGCKIVEAAPFGYGEYYNFTYSEEGEDLYQIISEPAPASEGIIYDFGAVEEGYAAISPIPTSLSDRVSLARMKNAFADDGVLTVIVDAQKDVLDYLPNKEAIEERLGTLAHCMSRMDMPMLMTETYGKGDIIRGVRNFSSRTETVERQEPDPWVAEDMAGYISLIDAKSVILAGVETHIALLQTALGFIGRGYKVIVLEDCCASENEDEHRRAIRTLRETGCEISSLETEVMKIAGDKDAFVRESIERILGKS